MVNNTKQPSFYLLNQDARASTKKSNNKTFYSTLTQIIYGNYENEAKNYRDTAEKK